VIAIYKINIEPAEHVAADGDSGWHSAVAPAARDAFIRRLSA
jgi:hypothetical protein